MNETVLMILTLWGTISAIWLVRGLDHAGWPIRLFVWAGAAAGLGMLIWSMIFEDYLPRADRLSERRRIEVLVGMAGYLIGLVLLLVGARKIVVPTWAWLRHREEDERVSPGQWLRVWGSGPYFFIGAIFVFYLATQLYDGRFDFY